MARSFTYIRRLVKKNKATGGRRVCRPIGDADRVV